MTEKVGINNFLDTMKDVQEKILNFLKDEAGSEGKFENLEKIFTDKKISDNLHELLSLLHLIAKISNNYHHSPCFFTKIEEILQYFQKDIIKYFSNYEIFNIFKGNKKILLFLIEQQIIVVDEHIVKKITTISKYIRADYPQYFQPEIKTFMNEKCFPKYDTNENKWIEEIKKDLPDKFYEKRKKGENDDPLCEIIRKDMIKEFIEYVSQNNISLNSTVSSSIYETNKYLNKTNSITLIEYAAFCGSIQIFKHLQSQNAELRPSILNLAIHGQKEEIIHIIEKYYTESDFQFFFESIKCHHNDIANYLFSKFLGNNEKYLQIALEHSIKHYNFKFIKDKYINKHSFITLCKYDHCGLVNELLKNEDIDINQIESNNNRKTAFYCAIEKENIEIVKLLLLNTKLDVNFPYTENYEMEKKTPFYLAVEKENIEIIKLLLMNNKTDINIPYGNYMKIGETYIIMEEKSTLYLAIEKGNIKIIKLLLSNDKLCVNTSRKSYKENNYNKYYKKSNDLNLPSSPFFVFSEEKPAFYYAIEKENIEIIKLLLNNDNLEINCSYKNISNKYNEEIPVFYLAIMKENIEIIELLSSNNKLNINNPIKRFKNSNFYGFERPPFYLAVEKENIEIIKLLLSNEKIDFNIPFYFHNENPIIKYYNYNKTASYLAVERGNIEIIKLLLMNDRINFNTPYIIKKEFSYIEKTAFYLAIENENIEMIKLLLTNQHLDISIPYKYKYFNYYEKTWIYPVIEKGNIEIIKLILEERQNIDAISYMVRDYKDQYLAKANNIIENKSLFYHAIEKRNLEIIKLLLENSSIDVNSSCKTHHYDDNNKNKVKIEEKTPFYLAIENHDFEIINLLLDSGKLNFNISYKLYYYNDDNKNTNGNNVIIEEKPLFYFVIEKGSIDIINILLMNCNFDTNLPYRKYKSIIKDNNFHASIELQDIIEEKPSFYPAIENEDIEVIKVLLKNNRLHINIPYSLLTNDKTKEATPLQLAFEANKIKIITLFLEYEDKCSPFNLNDKSIEGKIGEEIEFFEKTPLYSAVDNESVEAVQLLLRRPEININEKCFHCVGNNQAQSKTPLHLAVEKGYKDIIKLLIENKNIDVNSEDEQGRKPIDYTANNEIKQMLNK